MLAALPNSGKREGMCKRTARKQAGLGMRRQVPARFLFYSGEQGKSITCSICANPRAQLHDKEMTLLFNFEGLYYGAWSASDWCVYRPISPMH